MSACNKWCLYVRLHLFHIERITLLRQHAVDITMPSQQPEQKGKSATEQPEKDSQGPMKHAVKAMLGHPSSCADLGPEVDLQSADPAPIAIPAPLPGVHTRRRRARHIHAALTDNRHALLFTDPLQLAPLPLHHWQWSSRSRRGQWSQCGRLQRSEMLGAPRVRV